MNRTPAVPQLQKLDMGSIFPIEKTSSNWLKLSLIIVANEHSLIFIRSIPKFQVLCACIQSGEKEINTCYFLKDDCCEDCY